MAEGALSNTHATAASAAVYLGGGAGGRCTRGAVKPLRVGACGNFCSFVLRRLCAVAAC